jgi:hypothetical protein
VYAEGLNSRALPSIDLVQLASYLDRPTASQAIREYRAALAWRSIVQSPAQHCSVAWTTQPLALEPNQFD